MWFAYSASGTLAVSIVIARSMPCVTLCRMSLAGKPLGRKQASRRSRGLVPAVLGAMALALACSDTRAGGPGSGGSGAPARDGGAVDGSDSSASGDAWASDGASGSGGASAMGGSDGSGGAGGSGAAPDGGGSSDGGSEARDAGGADLCDVGVWDGGTPAVLKLSGNTFAHDPSVIEAGGVFYRFWTGNHIPQATSSDLKSWRNAPTVYGNDYPSWADDWLSRISNETFNFPWAPDVSFFNGQHHLYSSFSAVFGDNISCITHLTTSNIGGGDWTDHGPVICTQGSERYNAIDADVAVDTDGTPWLAFGSFWDGIMAFPLNPDGSRAGTEMTRLAWASQIEAPVLFRRCGYYYLFVSWGLCCPGEGRSVDQLSYRVAVGRSQNIMGPYVDRNGKPMVEGGGTVILEGDGAEWAAAGHSDVLATSGGIYHVYHAYRRSNGAAELRIVELPFDDQGWPVPGGP
jgi:arabinan endo-1,5-alpha-L-arabinosidase